MGESANMTECLRWAGPLPPQIRECRVACKDDCTLTSWSKFSECAGCGSSRSRKRSLTGKDFSSQIVEFHLHQWNDGIFWSSILTLENLNSHILTLHIGCCLSCSQSASVNALIEPCSVDHNREHKVVTLYTHSKSNYIPWYSGLLSWQHIPSYAEKPLWLWHTYRNPVQPLFSFWFCYCNFLLSLLYYVRSKLGLSQLVIPYFSADGKIWITCCGCRPGWILFVFMNIWSDARGVVVNIPCLLLYCS